MSNQKPVFKAQYENFIGGEWVAPVDGEYFDNASPIDGSHLCRIPKSNSKDIDLAVEAAHVDYWWKWVGLDGQVIGLTSFGASGPGPQVLEHFGFSAANIVDVANGMLPKESV